MVTIGSLTWTAKVEGAGNAQRKADNVADSMQEADEKASGLNSRLGQTGSRLKAGGQRARSLGTRMTRLTGIMGLVTSALFFLAGQLLRFRLYQVEVAIFQTPLNKTTRSQ